MTEDNAPDTPSPDPTASEAAAAVPADRAGGQPDTPEVSPAPPAHPGFSPVSPDEAAAPPPPYPPPPTAGTSPYLAPVPTPQSSRDVGKVVTIVAIAALVLGGGA